MNTTRLLIGVLLVSGVAGAAGAQVSPAAPTPQSPLPPTGQITIERIDHDIVYAPDARITEVNGETAALAGGYVGLLSDKTWLVGGGGYWLANQDDDLKMWYGGLVVGYEMRGQDRVGFAVRTLVGGGSATLGTTVGEYFGTDVPIGRPFPQPHGGHGPHLVRGGHGGNTVPVSPDSGIIAQEYFFAVEPQASIIWRFASWARLDLGAGYRLTAGAGPLDEDLRGPSASIAVRFGGSSHQP